VLLKPCLEVSQRGVHYASSRDVAGHKNMVDLHKKLAAASIAADKKLYQRQIETTDEEIDSPVYGLTEEEIAIVEGAQQ